MHRFIVLGCNHGAATLEEIAAARLPDEDVAEVAASLREILQVQELVYLPTCHRTEYYLAYEGEMCPGRLTMALARALPELTHDASSLPRDIESCLAVQGDKAARHLFRVASGLDALMVGESQVLGQVKSAFRQAADAGLAGPLLHTLFEQAFRAAKRVRTETDLARNPVSLITLAERRLRERLAADDRPVAVLGAGEMAGVTAALVRKLAPSRELVVFNRSSERAARLVEEHGVTPAALGDLVEASPRFAAVIAATSSPEPIVTPAVAARLAPTLLLDLAVPANVDGACREIDGIELVDQRELSSEAESNRAARAEEITSAEAIIDEQLEELAYEVMERHLSPVARSLVDAFREVARRELEALYGGNGNGQGEVEQAVDRLSKRLVRVPMRGLREVAWQHSPEILDTFLAALHQR